MGILKEIGKIGKGLIGGALSGLTGGLSSGIASAVAGKIGGGGAAGTDLVKLRNDAIKAGFNPLTVLGATGGQGYERGGLPALSSGAYLSEAIGRGVDTYFNTAPAADGEATSIRAMNDYIAARMAARAANPYQRFGFALTDVQPFGQVVSAGGPRLSGVSVGTASSGVGARGDMVAQGLSGLGTVPVPDPTLDRGNGLYIAGYRWEGAPGWSTGDQFEQEYGDTPLSWPYAAMKMSADVSHNAGRLYHYYMGSGLSQERRFPSSAYNTHKGRQRPSFGHVGVVTPDDRYRFPPLSEALPRFQLGNGGRQPRPSDFWAGF